MNNNKVTITIAGGAGNGLPTFAMLLARAAANAEMKVTIDHKLLGEIDENGVRKLGPEALLQRLIGLAEAGIELEIVFDQTPRGTAKGAAEQQDPQELPPPGSTFRKVEHPMAPLETPFAEVAPAFTSTSKIVPPPRGFILQLPTEGGGYTEAPPQPGVVVTGTPGEQALVKAGAIPMADALARGYDWMSKYPYSTMAPRLQPVVAELKYEVVEDGTALVIPKNPFEK